MDVHQAGHDMKKEAPKTTVGKKPSEKSKRNEGGKTRRDDVKKDSRLETEKPPRPQK
jgi:hypothetical protein